ncbi:MAG TPA: lipopolysaccharide biosynthesis protein [Micromonosporaceae bacterium]|nr:lipopolysaccharide biosynthesis protein [Micromonosporaceae bacterium]
MVALVALGGTRLLHGSLVSRATDTDTYGVIGSLIAITTIASLLLPAGVASAASRFIPYEHGRSDDAAARAVHRFLDRLGLPGAVALGLGAAGGAALAFPLSTKQIVEVFALAVAFAVYSVDKATLYGFGRIGQYVRLELASSALILLATVVVLALDTGTYLLPLALGYASFAVGARIVLRADVRGPVKPVGEKREILRYVGLACIGTLASQGFLQGTQLLANWFAAPAEVAYFVAAVTLVAPMYFLPRALGLALFPAMSRAHGAGDVAEVRRQADLSTRALLVLLAPLFAVGILLSREALTIFGSARFAPGAPVLQLILAATYFAVVAVAAVNTLSSGDHVHVPVLSGVLGALVGLGTVALLGGPLGAIGVGLGYLVGTAVTAGGPVGTAWRLHRMPWRAPLLWSVACVLAALAAGAGLNQLSVTGGERVAIDVAAALVAALVAVVVLRGQLAAVLSQARKHRRAAAMES